MFFGRHRPSSRRPVVNPKPLGGNDDFDLTKQPYENLMQQSCKRCFAIPLIWREDLENYFCCQCGWEPIKRDRKAEEEKVNQRERSQ
jgi:hypothetical protein